MANEAYIGAGIVYVNGRDVGNCSGVNFSFDVDSSNIPNYRGGGGNMATRERLSNVNVSMTMYEFSDENLALALRGATTAITAAAVTAEAVTAVGGGLATTEFMIDTAESVTVNGSGGTPSYALNDDFTVTPAGIIAVEGGGISDGADLEVDYTKKAGSVLEALINSGAEVSVVADIKNEADNDNPYVVKIHRFKPSPASSLPLIGDDFGEFELTGEALFDSSVVGSSKSKYFTVAKAS